MLQRILLAAALIAGSGTIAKTIEAESKPVPERNFRLFVGIDISARQQGELSAILDYEKNRVRLERDEGRSPVSLRDVSSFRVTHRPKLGHAPVTIGKTQSSRFYQSPEGVFEWTQSQAAQTAWDSNQHSGYEADLRAAEAFNTVSAGTNTQASALMSVAQSNYNDFVAPEERLINASNDPTAGASGDIEPNTLGVETEISSPYPIRDAYLVAVARIRSPESGYSEAVFFQDVPIIDTTPTHVRLAKSGLPREFEIMEVKLHLFREGRELATTESEKQFPLTRDEVREYLLMEHLSLHRGETLPPTPAWSIAPEILFDVSRPQDLDLPLTLNIDATGRVTGFNNAELVPDPIAAIMRDLMFFPALQEGAAVAGTTQVNLQDFFY